MQRLSSKPASLEEITKVIDALRVAGCTSHKEFDVESEEYEVGGVVCNDGKSYDIKLDKSFNVISKREYTSSSGYQLPASDVPSSDRPGRWFCNSKSIRRGPWKRAIC